MYENKNKDEKGLVLAVIIICVILFIAAIGLFVSSFYGFKDKKTSNIEESREEVVSKAEQKLSDDGLNEEQFQVKDTVENFLECIKARDFNKACKYTCDNKCSLDFVEKELNKEDNTYIQFNMFLKKMLDYNYTIESIDTDGDEAHVKLYIETYNFTTTVMEARLNVCDKIVAYKLEKESLSDEKQRELAQNEVEHIFADMDRKLKVPAEISLIYKDGAWKIDNKSIDDSLRPAIVKNLQDSIKAYSDFYEELNDNYNRKITEVSLRSFISFLESKGVYYDEDSETSPFDK